MGLLGWQGQHISFMVPVDVGSGLAQVVWPSMFAWSSGSAGPLVLWSATFWYLCSLLPLSWSSGSSGSMAADLPRATLHCELANRPTLKTVKLPGGSDPTCLPPRYIQRTTHHALADFLHVEQNRPSLVKSRTYR